MYQEPNIPLLIQTEVNAKVGQTIVAGGKRYPYSLLLIILIVEVCGSEKLANYVQKVVSTKIGNDIRFVELRFVQMSRKSNCNKAR